MKKQILSVISTGILAFSLCALSASADTLSTHTVVSDSSIASVTEDEPLTVTGLKVVEVTTDTVSLRWDNVPESTGCDVDVFLNNEWISYHTSYMNSDFAYLQNLPSGTKLQFRVRLFSGDVSAPKYGEYSEIIEATTLLKEIQSFAIGGKTSDALRLNWTADETADGYIIEKYDGTKWVRVKKITNNQTSTYRLTGLAPSTKYKFRIKSFSIDDSVVNYSEYSETISGYTNPSVISNLRLGGKAGTALRLNWDKNASADGYIIEKYDGTKWVRIKKLTNNTVTTFRVEGLFSGVTYKFRMRAYKMNDDVAYYSGYTSTLSATTNVNYIPQNLKQSSQTTTSATLSWNAVPGATKYSVQIYKNGKWITNNNVSKNSYTFSKLSKNTKYKVRVRSYVNSKYNSFSPITYISSTPSTPTGLKQSTNTTSSFTVKWAKNANADGYEVQVFRSGKWVAYKTTSTSFKVTGLIRDNNYKVRVRAYMNVAGKTVYSPFSSIITADTYTAVSKKYSELVDYLKKNAEQDREFGDYSICTTRIGNNGFTHKTYVSYYPDIDTIGIYIISNNNEIEFIVAFYLYPHDDTIKMESSYLEQLHIYYAECNFSRSSFTSDTELNFKKVYSEFSNISISDISSANNELIRIMFEDCDTLLHKTVGFGLKELGFSSYVAP